MTKTKKKLGRPRKDGPRDQNGRIVRPQSRAQREAAMMAVVEARSRAVGIWPEPLKRDPGEPQDVWEARQAARVALIRASARYVTLPWMGCCCGRMIRGESDVTQLWETLGMIRSRHAAYQRAIDAPRLKGADATALANLQEEGDGVVVSLTSTDPRSEEERAIAAVAAWERMIERAPIDRLLEAVDDTPTRGFIGWLRDFREAMETGRS